MFLKYINLFIMGRDITSMMKGLNVATKKKSLQKITKKDDLSDLFGKISLKPREVDNLAGLFDRLSVSDSSDMNLLMKKLSKLKVEDITKITRKMKNMSVKKEVKSRVKVLPSQKGMKTQITTTQMDDLFKQGEQMRMMEIDDELDAFFGTGGAKKKPSLRRMKATIYEFKKSKSPKKRARGTSAIKKRKRVIKKKVKSAPQKRSVPSTKDRSYAKKVIVSMKKLRTKTTKPKKSPSKPASKKPKLRRR